MEVKLEFCGGAESHNNGEKIMTMQFPEDTSLRDIFRMLRGGDVSTYIVCPDGPWTQSSVGP